MMNIGIETIRRFLIGFWLNFKASAMINRILRNAVSPDVIGQTTTPIIAIIAPKRPNHELQIASTIIAGVFPAVAAAFRPSAPQKYAMAAVAQIMATIPSEIMAP